MVKDECRARVGDARGVAICFLAEFDEGQVHSAEIGVIRIYSPARPLHPVDVKRPVGFPRVAILPGAIVRGYVD